MAHEMINIDWREELRHQDRIVGRLVSGQKFKGKVHSCATDHIQIVDLEIQKSDGSLERESEVDIVRLRLDSIMFFDKIR